MGSPTKKLQSSKLIEEIKDGPIGAAYIRRTLRRGLIVVGGALSIYFMQEQLRDVVSSAERLRDIEPGWFMVMAITETLSFLSLWWLTKIVLPKVSWFVAVTSQLASNAVSRVVPGGAAAGGATLYRMLATSGVSSSEAGGALAATSILTTAALFAIPASSLLLALLGAPIPGDLLPAAITGGALFIVLAVVGVVFVVFTWPLLGFGRLLGRVFRALGRLFRREWGMDPQHLVVERDRLVAVLGPRWPQSIVASAGKWAFDYLTLIAALYSVGVDPHLSLVLLAYAGAAVLAMIPLTPGGFGFVEVGLSSILVKSLGMSFQDASAATIAYRVASLWLPIVAGSGAWVLFARKRPELAQVSKSVT